jgi:hypothetical protein
MTYNAFSKGYNKTRGNRWFTNYNL